MPENQPGNGYDAPFGDGKGATESAGPSTGAHDFLTDPESNAPETGGRDFTKESRPQPADGPADDINDDSIPDGGVLPFAGPDKVAAACDDVGTIVEAEKHKPFKLGGA